MPLKSYPGNDPYDLAVLEDRQVAIAAVFD
jgi:hypothetical protein